MMKKIIFICMIMMGLLLVGCQPKYEINLETEQIILRVGDTYQLNVTHPIGEDLTYRDPKQLVSISKLGLITANAPGETTIYIEAANTKRTSIAIEVILDPSSMRVYFVDVGQADCMIAILPNEEVLMIDCGLDYESTMGDEKYPSWAHIEEILTRENIQVIDHLIITHNHSDHYYYVPELIASYEVKHIYSSGSVRYNSQYLMIMRSIEYAGLTVEVLKTGDFIIDEGPLTLQVVATQVVEEDEDINYSSVMTKLTYYNRSFMLTGDAGSDPGDGEPIALASGIDLNSDVLKVGHHGSMYASGTSFLQAVTPLFAIITTAQVTSTGHPHNSALDRLASIEATILQSKDYGTILFTTDGFDLSYTTEKVPS